MAQGGAANKREGYPLRPELIESVMYLYRATRDPFLLTVGEDMLQSIQVGKIRLLTDQMPCTVGSEKYLLRLPLVYLPCCLMPCSQGKPSETLKKTSLQSLLYEAFCHLVNLRTIL